MTVYGSQNKTLNDQNCMEMTLNVLKKKEECIMCKNGFFLKDGLCKECEFGDSCKRCTEKECVECLEGFAWINKTC
jgi:hypothetical protein